VLSVLLLLEQLPGTKSGHAPPWQTRLRSEYKSRLHVLVLIGSRYEPQRVAAGKGKLPYAVCAQVGTGMGPWTWKKPQSLLTIWELQDKSHSHFSLFENFRKLNASTCIPSSS